MKKLISLAILSVLVAGSAFAMNGDDGSPAKKRETGAPGFIPYREYAIARFGAVGVNDVGLSAGDVVVRDTVSDDGVTIALIGTGQSVDAVAGVVVSANISTAESTGLTASLDYGRRNWGVIQVKGHSTKVNILSGGVPAGSAIVASSTARYATAPANTAGVKSKLMGFAYDASAQGQSEAWIDL